jgi:hypothetical protein
MKKEIDNVRKIRTALLEGIKNLDTDQLNKIPDGFGNNIIWNLAHVVSAQQSICYKRAGLEALLDDDFINTYKPGTKPEKFVDTAGIENIKQLLFSTLDQLETDYNNNIFKEYTPVTTRYGVELNNIEEGISFLSFHEGYHMGSIMGLKKLV